MVHHQFAALGDPTRLAIVERLARGPTSVGDLAAPTTMSLPAVLKHLRVPAWGRAQSPGGPNADLLTL